MSRILKGTIGTFAALTLVVGVVGCNPCEDSEGLVICGDFGTLAFSVQPPGWGAELRWPPVATERNTLIASTDAEVFEVSENGVITSLNFDLGRASAPSLARDGTLYVVFGSQAMALDPELAGSARDWTQFMQHDSATTPPAIGDGEVHVAMSSEDRQERSLTTLDIITGEVRSRRAGVSPPAVDEDGELRYLEGPEDCGARFGALVAEDPEGRERWRYQEQSGIRDFAPGPDGETYIVTGDNELRRISMSGGVDWSFKPDCEDCNVAAAPTVTEERVYFPVWVGWSTNPGCDEPEPEDVDTLDPLYALTRDGEELWVYDGFDTVTGDPGGHMAMLGIFGLASVPVARHHPAGRPTVAEDGTLYVATDGAIVALDEDGNQLGYAMFEPSAGEIRQGDGGLMTTSTFNNTGVSRAPVLGPDGSLYMWDGEQIRAFETDEPAKPIPWSAPFGGYRNAGRVGG